jgi:thiosulfate/3-mercaptopyruvate sulfurtransferase
MKLCLLPSNRGFDCLRRDRNYSPAEAKKLIDNPDPAKRPIVLDTRGGYKDYFRGHLPTAHHINFDTLRGTDLGVPVQYLPEDLTRALLV